VTVGIVLVSHSAELARGAATLARQMAGDVAVEPAGGLAEPGEPLGTDAARVAEAIGRADSGDGVLVLADLGSAVLSAKIAAELVADVRTLLSDAPLVEGAVAAAVAAQVGEPLAAVAAEAGRGLAGKQAQLGDAEAVPPASRESGYGEAPERRERGQAADQQRPPGRELRTRLRIVNRLGLHGRPAAQLVRTVARFDADTAITDLTTGRGPVPARSLSSLMTLGTVGGHQVEVTASGPDAAAVLEALQELAAAGFGEDTDAAPGIAGTPGRAAAGEQATGRPAALTGSPAPTPGSTVPAGAVPPAAGPSGVSLRGLPAAPGSVLGRVRHLRRAQVPEPDAPPGPAEQEAAKLRAAVAAVRDELAAAQRNLAAASGADAADILEVQVLLLEDEALLGAALHRTAVGESARRAWRQAADDVLARYQQLPDEYQRARADDIVDLARRVSAVLAGISARMDIAGEGVVVADLLGPADTVALDRHRVAGILTARGAPTGHAAILARSLGIPAVVGAGDAVLRLAEGETVLLDGDTGVAFIRPAANVRVGYERRRARAEVARAKAVHAAAGPAVTADGLRVAVEANIGSVDEASAAASLGADGVGLLRTEFLFLGRPTPPEEDEQAAVYAAIAAELRGAPVTVRTLDVGADKPAPYLPQPAEDNPFLGVRGLRLALGQPDLLLTQLRAVLRVAAQHPLRLMFPMVTTVDELDQARELLRQARVQTATQHVPLPVGIMVEVPAAALTADAFAGRADFFSAGTNDLTQYTLAAERGNAAVAGLADPCHPAVLALLDRAAKAAADKNRPLAVCGEMAADPAAVPLLVGLGVTELSVVPAQLPLVKQAVRGTSLADARRLAALALAATSAAEVRGLLHAPVADPGALAKTSDVPSGASEYLHRLDNR
jgi:multiphosphoryl transfer protein